MTKSIYGGCLIQLLIFEFQMFHVKHFSSLFKKSFQENINSYNDFKYLFKCIINPHLHCVGNLVGETLYFRRLRPGNKETGDFSMLYLLVIFSILLGLKELLHKLMNKRLIHLNQHESMTWKSTLCEWGFMHKSKYQTYITKNVSRETFFQ